MWFYKLFEKFLKGNLGASRKLLKCRKSIEFVDKKWLQNHQENSRLLAKGRSILLNPLFLWLDTP